MGGLEGREIQESGQKFGENEALELRRNSWGRWEGRAEGMACSNAWWQRDGAQGICGRPLGMWRRCCPLLINGFLLCGGALHLSVLPTGVWPRLLLTSPEHVLHWLNPHLFFQLLLGAGSFLLSSLLPSIYSSKCITFISLKDHNSVFQSVVCG